MEPDAVSLRPRADIVDELPQNHCFSRHFRGIRVLDRLLTTASRAGYMKCPAADARFLNCRRIPAEHKPDQNSFGCPLRMQDQSLKFRK
ncbi:MAG: hypothetical protein CMM00_15360 [Rhodopirellula sp.]|uniref:Uncharacterized protein n=1 Tax=Rhodopirellula europaea SH398 TaxID=1263868 RepID=M5RYY2_9BACT|nr:hypothetical protein RESH_04934 [Rhodopirellula europaea SH398]MAP10093.1 hypothetical protein [Rhodopirellula sp.]